MHDSGDSHFDTNDSPWWQHRERSTPCTPLHEDLTADIVIVGAGLTGLSSAWHLSTHYPEKTIVVLEAKEVAHGASGRNGGLALNWFDEMDVRTKEYAQHVYGLTQETLQTIHSLASTGGCPDSFRFINCANLYTKESSFDAAARTAEQAQQAGIDIRIIDKEALRSNLDIQHVYGAIVDPAAGQLDGVGFLNALASLLRERGIRIFEESPVQTIEETLPAKVSCIQGSVTADAVILATNAYSPLLGYFSDKVIPLHSYVIATESRSMEQWKELGFTDIEGFSDDRSRLSYGCINRFGELLFGGGSNASYYYGYGGKTALHQRSPRSFQAVKKILLHYFPQVASIPIKYQWSGPVAISLDRRCMMGVRGEHKNIFYALGFSGHGITMATMAGRVLCDLYQDDVAAWKDFPFFMRKGYPFPPEPLRWIGYKGFTTFTGKSPRKHVEQ